MHTLSHVRPSALVLSRQQRRALSHSRLSSSSPSAALALAPLRPRSVAVFSKPDATPGSAAPAEPEDEDLLDSEEDWVVPGGPSDSLSPNTPLGKAIRAACDELEHLNNMEMDSLKEAQDLLSKLGYKGTIFKGTPPPLYPKEDETDAAATDDKQ